MRSLLTRRPAAVVLAAVTAFSLSLAMPAVAAAVPPFAVHVSSLYAASPQAEAHFGTSVDVSGDTIVVGEPDRVSPVPGAVGMDRGAVYVYVRGASGWVLQQELLTPFPQVDTQYGASVAIDGNVLVVGSPGYTTTGGKTGAAFVYRRTGTTWTLEKYLPGVTVGGLYGTAVAIDADTVAVGASMDDGGMVQVWHWSGVTWASEQILTMPGGVPGDQFGGSVALEGDTLIAGAPGDHYGMTGDVADAGSAHWFSRSAGVWSWRHMIVPPAFTAGGSFGGPIAISGSRALIGSWQTTVGTVPGAGTAHSFTNDGATWTHESTFTAPAPAAYDYYGSSVALDGGTALIGAFFSESYHGSAYFYTEESGTWTMRQKLDMSTYTPGVWQLGTSAALSGGTAVLGAQMAGSPDPSLVGAGGAFIFGVRGITGVVRDAVTGLPVAGIEVSAYVPDLYGEPDLVALANTDASGRYWLPVGAGSYGVGWMDGAQAYYPGFHDDVQLYSQSSTVSVQAIGVSTLDLSIHRKPVVYLTKPLAPSSVRRYRRFTAYGYLKPRHRARSYPVTLECFQCQRQPNGGYDWVLAKTVSARAYDYRPNRRRAWYTKYKATFSLPSRGKWRIRAYHAADATYGPTYTGWRYVTVR
jgi:hypothetical protein